MTPIGPHLTVFLREYIPSQREMSVQTSDTYAYAFQLLVCFAAETPENHSLGALDRATRRDTRTGLPRTPREEARELRQNTEFKTGRYQDVLPVFGIPATVMS